tara:strand:+ start:244 stop:741 length:498 start_codon:yes stop_codon:yes gene_type:complete
MNYLKVSFCIFAVLAISRFVPHPPNFTTLFALSFYVPALLGIRFIPALLISFFVTDLIIGFHGTTLFTWGSVLIIGLISKYFNNGILKRILGSLTGAFIFFVLTNFGVWVLGFYGYTFEGLVRCYILAIPFFAYSLISTFIFSTIIETLYKFKTVKNFIQIYSFK